MKNNHNINNKRRLTESSSSSSPQQMANHSNSLTPDIIKGILSRLPIKSLKRFESVSKSWYTLITSYAFIFTHLNCSSRSSYLLIHNPSCSKFSITLMDDKATTFRDIRIPFLDSLFRFPKIVGSCDGLLCLDISPCYAMGFVLWNVGIKQFRFLPRPIIDDVVKPIWMVATGFGFNQQTSDYKLVRLVNFRCDQGNDFVIRAEVYSWSSGSWRVLDSTMIEKKIGAFVVNEGQNAISANGSLHWLANEFDNLSNHKCIICFDMATEEFRTVKAVDTGSGICTKLLEFKGSLALALYPALNVYPGYGRSVSRIELWVFEDDCGYGDGDIIKQWTKLYSVDLNSSVMGSPISVHNDFELLLKRVTGNCIYLVFLNFIDQSINSLPICSSEYPCQFYTYCDSLVPVSNAENEGEHQMQEMKVNN